MYTGQIGSDIDLPPNNPFNFSKHSITILPTADTLEPIK